MVLANHGVWLKWSQVLVQIVDWILNLHWQAATNVPYEDVTSWRLSLCISRRHVHEAASKVDSKSQACLSFERSTSEFGAPNTAGGSVMQRCCSTLYINYCSFNSWLLLRNENACQTNVHEVAGSTDFARCLENSRRRLASRVSNNILNINPMSDHVLLDPVALQIWAISLKVYGWQHLKNVWRSIQIVREFDEDNCKT